MAHHNSRKPTTKQRFWPFGSKRESADSAHYEGSSLTPYVHPDRSAEQASAHARAPHTASTTPHEPWPAPSEKEVSNAAKAATPRRKSLNARTRKIRLTIILICLIYMGWQYFVDKGGTEVLHEGRNEEITSRLEAAGLDAVSVSSEAVGSNSEIQHHMTADYTTDSPDDARRAFEAFAAIADEQRTEGRDYLGFLYLFVGDDEITLSVKSPKDALPLLLEHAEQGTLKASVTEYSLNIRTKETPLEVYAPLVEEYEARFPDADVGLI